MIPTPESESESDFYHFSEFVDSVSSKNRFLYCTGINSGYWNQFQNRILMIPIPAKNRIITPLIQTLCHLVDVRGEELGNLRLGWVVEVSRVASQGRIGLLEILSTS